MLKVVQLSKYYAPFRGGIETHVRCLSEQLVRQGADVTVVCLAHHTSRQLTPVWTQETFEGVKVIRITTQLSIGKLDLSLGLLAPSLRRLIAAADIVHVHNPNPVFTLCLFGLWFKYKRLIITHHSDVIRQRFLYHLLRFFEHSVYSRARAIFSDGPFYVTGSRVLQRFKDKTTVVPLGINLDPFLAVQRPVLQTEIQWLCVGRLVYYKGFDVAIRALSEAPGRLVLVGKGPEEDALKRLVTDLSLEARVDFRGAVSDEDLRALLGSSRALLFPSVARSEGFGLSQVEAMAAGLPVINTSIPGSDVSWVSQHDLSGLTVPPGDSSALSAAMKRLAEDQLLFERLALGARKRASSEFSEEMMGNNVMQCYRSLK